MSRPVRINNYAPCGGLEWGVYVVAFHDCPHCETLLNRRRFKRLMYVLNKSGFVFRLIFFPRQFYGGQFNEMWYEDIDNCIANYALLLAYAQGFLNYDTQRYHWLDAYVTSPLILLVPPEPRKPIIMPMELVGKLTMYPENSPEFNEALLFITAFLRGKVYGAIEEIAPAPATRRTRGARATAGGGV